MAGRPAMSLEAMLDEERREVLALLEGPSASARARASASMGARSPSPYTPRSPVRSMLDIGDDTSPATGAATSLTSGSKKSPTQPAPVRSMLDIATPAPLPVRSMLDVDSPPHSATKQVFSNPTSPIESNFRTLAANKTVHPRSMSDAATRPADFGPRSSAPRLISPDPTVDYQFGDIVTNNAGQPLPKRVGQGGRRPAGSSMAEVMRDLAISGGPGDRGRHHSVSGPVHNKSKSPHNRLGLRSNSPHANILPGRHLSPAGRAVLADGKTVDMHNAYRRLSDANLALSGGSLSELTRRKRSDDATSGRLTKSYLSPDGEVLPEDSSDDDGASSSDDEGERGRKAARTFGKASADDEADPTSPGSDAGKPQRQTLSLLAAAEEERIQVAAKQPAYKYRSLLDEPEITVTAPSGERVKQSRSGVHPATSFDEPPRSLSRAPLDSDTEADLTDIKRAQKLSFSMTSIMSYPESHRAIRIIYRGDYSKIAHDMEAEDRRQRKYLVATDLSEESTHALEWAIGTVLRDGDTLIAIYCVDEETGIVTNDGALVPDEPKAMKEQAAAINAVTSSKTPVTPGGVALTLHQHRASPLVRTVDAGASISPSPAPSSRERSKAEEERLRAVQDITDRVTKLLRKTRLQVRVIVEVLHCKNPRHLITEVIDLVNPTLVILGSRGRSALKGVILGSFSNYLVTKSAVPVMVARKRLRKQSKYKRPVPRQVNNLSNPSARSLANAKID